MRSDTKRQIDSQTARPAVCWFTSPIQAGLELERKLGARSTDQVPCAGGRKAAILAITAASPECTLAGNSSQELEPETESSYSNMGSWHLGC